MSDTRPLVSLEVLRVLQAAAGEMRVEVSHVKTLM